MRRVERGWTRLGRLIDGKPNSFVMSAPSWKKGVERGNEIIIEREDHSECIALTKAHEAELGYAPVLDADFAQDVQECIDAHREPIRNVWDE